MISSIFREESNLSKISQNLSHCGQVPIGRLLRGFASKGWYLAEELVLNRGTFHLDKLFGWISRGVEEHLVYKG
jgi:hypothetical protein